MSAAVGLKVLSTFYCGFSKTRQILLPRQAKAKIQEFLRQ